MFVVFALMGVAGLKARRGGLGLASYFGFEFEGECSVGALVVWLYIASWLVGGGEKRGYEMENGCQMGELGAGDWSIYALELCAQFLPVSASPAVVVELSLPLLSITAS